IAPAANLASAGVFKAPPKPAVFDQRWAAWGSGFGGGSTTEGDAAAGTDTVTAHTFGFAAGLDYPFTPDAVAGLAPPRRRRQLGRSARARWRPERCLSGRRLRHDAYGSGLYRRRACFRQSLDDD